MYRTKTVQRKVTRPGLILFFKLSEIRSIFNRVSREYKAQINLIFTKLAIRNSSPKTV